MSRIVFATAALAVAFASSGLAQDTSRSAPAKSDAVKPPSPSAADAKTNSQPQSSDQAKASPPAAATAPDPNSLANADIRDFRLLARRLEVMGEADLFPTAAVWRSFTVGAKAAAKRVAHASSADAIDQRVVLNALNAWLETRNAATETLLRPDYVRDAELQLLLGKTELSAAETYRRNRLLIELMFPLEVAHRQGPSASGDSAVVSRYPPNRLPEVTLSLSVPGLRGRINVFLPGDKTLTFRGDQPVTIKTPNDGTLRYAITGDDYDQPFSREITWNPDDVKNGVVERTLPLLKSGRNP